MTANPNSRSAPVSNLSPRGGLKVVAAVEAAKGVVILLAGFGLLSLVHEEAQAVAEELVRHLHMNPASRFPRIFLDLAGHLTDQRLWMLAGFALAYSGLRFIEAYGLWRERRWAEWLAAVSGGIYIPFEVHEILTGISWLNAIVLVVNLAVVGYMVHALRHPPAVR
jgi:uncharacterized membrane protein (DUF2068 family)